MIYRVFLLIVGLWSSGLFAHLMPVNRELQSAYELSEPYAFHEHEGARLVVKGLDPELVAYAFDEMGYSSHYQLMPWSEQLKALKEGSIDYMLGAFQTPEREQFAYFSDRYRDQVDQIYMRKQAPIGVQIRSWIDVVHAAASGELRLGVQAGYLYAAPEMKDLLQSHGHRLIYFHSGSDALLKLHEGKLDAIIMDRIEGSTFIDKMHLAQEVVEAPIPTASLPVRIMFSKKTVTPEEVASFNEELAQMGSGGASKRIVRHYMLPLFTEMTIASPWFYAIEILAMVALAVPGLILARSHGYDFFGAFLLCAMPGLGGGILRDLLVNRHPVFVLRRPGYVISLFVVWALFWLLSQLSQSFRRETEQGFSKPYFLGGSIWGLGRWLVALFDALGYAAFTVVGVVVSVQSGIEPLWLWGPVFATMTVCTGGILRDLLHKDGEMMHLRGGLVPELSLVWGFIFAQFLIWETDRLVGREIFLGLVLTLLGMFLSQIWVFWAKWKSPKY